MEIFNLIALFTVLLLPFFKTKGRGIVVLGLVSIQVIISSIVAFKVFSNGLTQYSYTGSFVTGPIPVRIDYLSAWFILVISFTFFTGAWYGAQYMKQYVNQGDNITLHIIAFILVYTSMIDIVIVQNGLVMLIIWELMALGSFVMVIFEHHRKETLKAGINFLIQSHVCILFLTVAFIWARSKSGSFDFAAISAFTNSQPAMVGTGLFLFFFIGFAIKAGFVPFHTWLPLAHPAAPAHISGIMSGVIIKIGIYGILRMLLLIKTDLIDIGYFIIAISVTTGVYGVMMAIVQHNLKKLLAFHSIENIGIIGIGIGIGSLGLGFNNQLMVVCGLGGALLHTLNHSLFKSLLFFTAGNVYESSHTMDIEALGGLIKHIPKTGYLFLISSLAICGLPPFNGFVSEFFIYSGLFNGLSGNQLLSIIFLLFTILGLVLIGGLAMICFTKAFGIVFLGNQRSDRAVGMIKENLLRTGPLYLIAIAILVIGIYPVLLYPFLQKIVQLYQPLVAYNSVIQLDSFGNVIAAIGKYASGFIIVMLSFYYLRYLVTSRRVVIKDNTWGCGYVGIAAKTQYTASSFIRTYRKLAEPFLDIKKEKREAHGLYPDKIRQSTHPHDKTEKWLIDKPIHFIKRVLNSFVFLQNGRIQVYILYGFIFVGSAIVLPFIIEKILLIFKFFNQI